MPTATVEIVDFIDQNTGAYANAAQITNALTSGSYGGLTAIGADGQALPLGTPLSAELQTGLPARLRGATIRQDPSGNFVQQAAPPNYLLWAAIAFGIWYFLLRKK